MAHFASNKFNYWGQLGILLLLLGVGMIAGSIASFIPLMGKINFHDLKSGSAGTMIEGILKPENANAIRWMQFLLTLFFFFLPPVAYALVCHSKPFVHLGFNHSIKISQILWVIAIMFVCLPLVASLQDLTEMLPWSKATLLKFKLAEDDYNKQVAVIARMNNVWDYFISVLVIALLPAVFEETLFRGGLQNLLSRWIKMPIVAIIITSIIFSAVHGSYLGFLSRFALGFVLGWIYYRTGNIWLNIVGHFFNNGLAITALYMSSTPGKSVDLSKMDEHFPLWVGALSLAAVIFLFKYFENDNKDVIDRPGREVLMEDVHRNFNPFDESNNTNHSDFII